MINAATSELKFCVTSLPPSDASTAVEVLEKGVQSFGSFFIFPSIKWCYSEFCCSLGIKLPILACADEFFI